MTIKLKGSTDGSVSLTAPADTSPSGTDITMTLPTTAGSANQFVKNSGTAGTLEYSSMVEDSSNNVGIGTASPTRDLTIKGTGETLLFDLDTTTADQFASIAWQATTASLNPGDMSAEIRGYRQASGALGALAFHTRSSTTSVERMRINASGNVGIGTSDIDGQLEVRSSGALGIISRSTSTQSTDGNKALRVRNNSDTDTFNVSYKGNIEVGGDGSGVVPGIELSNYTGDGSTIRSKRALVLEADYDNNSGTGQSYMAFKTDGTEHLRIDGAGHILYNQTSTATPGFNNTTIGLAVEHLSSGAALFVSRSDSLPFCVNRNSNGTVVDLRRDGSQKGNIQVTTTTATFNSASDYRLKENVVALSDGITRLKQLNPSRFNFIEEPDTTVDGFIAHEAQAVVPEAVTGTHNEVDDDGNPVMQGMDYGKVTPLLTAALQEAIAKIETLETKVAALEAGS